VNYVTVDTKNNTIEGGAIEKQPPCISKNKSKPCPDS